ncbi:AraC family transcriptional regulator [Nocardia sp. NPDC051030]|uniref:AraC family transcriptional regulator n=1 Tax=Nocardia sp. NPDC051030 TaxID=3155162 RepID=UPI003419E792
MADGSVRTLPQTCYPTVWLWPGHALYAGVSLDLAPHSGSVWCLAVGVDQPFTVRVAGAEPLVTGSALIPPRTTHQLISGGGRMIFCYLDPAAQRAESCRKRMFHWAGPIGAAHKDENRLRALGGSLLTGSTPATAPVGGSPNEIRSPDATPGRGTSRTATDSREIAPPRNGSRSATQSAENTPGHGDSAIPDHLDDSARQWIDCAAPAFPHASDPRVADATRWIRDDPGGAFTARELAARVGLSESRFLHLFRQDAGTSLRRYRLWVRLMHAAALLEAGKSLTTVAVEAGFASPSHLSDRFRTTFGLSATRLLENGLRIRVQDSDSQ